MSAPCVPLAAVAAAARPNRRCDAAPGADRDGRQIDPMRRMGEEPAGLCCACRCHTTDQAGRPRDAAAVTAAAPAAAATTTTAVILTR